MGGQGWAVLSPPDVLSQSSRLAEGFAEILSHQVGFESAGISAPRVLQRGETRGGRPGGADRRPPPGESTHVWAPGGVPRWEG